MYATFSLSTTSVWLTFSHSSSTSISGYAWRSLSGRSNNQCVLLPKCCSKHESIRPLLLFSTTGYPTTKLIQAILFGMFKERHGSIRGCTPGPISSEAVDGVEKYIWRFCSSCCSVLWFGICDYFRQRCCIALLWWLADGIYKLDLCSYWDDTRLRFMIYTTSILS